LKNFKIFNDINEATARERYYYELLNAKLNTNCPGRNKAEYNKEYNKEYQENNKDKIQKIKKEYYENNKDKIQKINKEYRENNKDKINAIKKTHHICNICNGKYTNNNRVQHINSKKHQTALNNND